MSNKQTSSELYRALLAKVKSIDLGSNTFWSPKEGRSVVRVLPPVGEMDFFFKEVGRHYIANKTHICPLLSTDGQQECPACDVNDMLYRAGEKETASKFRVSRRFYMNVVVRGEESAGPRIFTPGITIFSAIVALISDPDYGDVTDIDEGTDIIINRKGTGLDTEYQVMARRNASELGTDEQVDTWLDAAKDLEAYIADKLMPYEDLAEETGAAVYLGLDAVDEEDEEDAEYEEDAPEDVGSIKQRLAKRRSGRSRGTRR